MLRLWSLVRQVFIERDGELEFVGLWSDVESLNECEALPPEVKIRLLIGNNAKGYIIVGLSSIPYIPTLFLVFELGSLSWTWEPNHMLTVFVSFDRSCFSLSSCLHPRRG